MFKIQVFCDFDGTITKKDTVDLLLSELADPEWEAIETLWVRGEISARECMARQVPLIKGGWTAVSGLLDKLETSEGVNEFVDWCRSLSIPFVVVSDGLDRVIEYMLAKSSVRANAVFANHLIESENGDFSLQASARPRLAGCQSGVCKCQIVGSQAYRTIRVVIGDGRSDFCWAKEADLLFSKGKLSEYAEAQKIAYNNFDNFLEIKNSLQALLEGRAVSLAFNKEIPGIVPGIASGNPEPLLQDRPLHFPA